MNFTIDGGTDQQRGWVNNAIADCSYPLDQIPTDVTVKWGAFPNHLDTTHPYMCTTQQPDGSCIITIAPWADDPNASGVQGLPDPPADVQDFYQGSFVHELGHVVAYSTFDNTDDNPDLPNICDLFWRASTTSEATPFQIPGTDVKGNRRFGALADWDGSGLGWSDQIRESFADFFRLNYYTGRNVYGNRTNWNIDQNAWTSGLSWWSGPGSGGPAWQEFGSIDAQASEPHYDTLLFAAHIDSIGPLNEWGQAEVTLTALTAQDSVGRYELTAGVHVGTQDWYEQNGGVLDYAAGKNEDVFVNDMGYAGNPVTAIGSNLLSFQRLFIPAEGGGDVATLFTAPISLTGGEWLALRVEGAVWTAELWDADPFGNPDPRVHQLAVVEAAGNLPITLSLDSPPTVSYKTLDASVPGTAETALNVGNDALIGSPTGSRFTSEDSPTIVLTAIRIIAGPPDPEYSYGWGDTFVADNEVPYLTSWDFATIGGGELLGLGLPAGTQAWDPSTNGLIEFVPHLIDGTFPWIFAAATQARAQPAFFPYKMSNGSVGIGRPLRGAIEQTVQNAGRLPQGNPKLKTRAELSRDVEQGHGSSKLQELAYLLEQAEGYVLAYESGGSPNGEQTKAFNKLQAEQAAIRRGVGASAALRGMLIP